MSLDAITDIFFLGVVVGACFAVYALRKLGYRAPEEQASGPADKNDRSTS